MTPLINGFDFKVETVKNDSSEVPFDLARTPGLWSWLLGPKRTGWLEMTRFTFIVTSTHGANSTEGVSLRWRPKLGGKWLYMAERVGSEGAYWTVYGQSTLRGYSEIPASILPKEMRALVDLLGGGTAFYAGPIGNQPRS